MKYRKKPVVIEAITFEELVEHGRAHAVSFGDDGMPWSFCYHGHAITHEDNDCYLIPTLDGTMRFKRGDMLITGVNCEVYPCKPDIFAKTYELAGDGVDDHDGDEIWCRDDDLLVDTLSLVLDPFDFDSAAHHVKLWSDENHRLAWAWAGAVHLAASDSPVETPAKPLCVVTLEAALSTRMGAHG